MQKSCGKRESVADQCKTEKMKFSRDPMQTLPFYTYSLLRNWYEISHFIHATALHQLCPSIYVHVTITFCLPHPVRETWNKNAIGS